MDKFIYAQPVRIRFGEGSLGDLPEVLKECGIDRCVLVCGRHFAARAEELKQNIPAIRAIFSEVDSAWKSRSNTSHSPESSRSK